LPFDEAYWIPEPTAGAIASARHEGRRIVAVGTTVVRALEHSASRFGLVVPGRGIATQRIAASTSLQVADAILSGTHEPGTSHYELLQAFADTEFLRRAVAVHDAAGFRTHEFGDSVLIERDRRKYSRAVRPAAASGKSTQKQALAGAAAPRILRAFSATPLHVVQESHRLPPAQRLVAQRG
jgi:S-adenosylmethionine:tRNA ribosyltransferase-isomerase